jgi:hypothetical protein
MRYTPCFSGSARRPVIKSDDFRAQKAVEFRFECAQACANVAHYAYRAGTFTSRFAHRLASEFSARADDPERHREAPLVIGLYQISRPLPGREIAARAQQQAPQLSIEGSRHSRRGDHRHGLHALGDNMQFDLVAGRGEPILAHHHTPASPSHSARISKVLRNCAIGSLLG